MDADERRLRVIYKDCGDIFFNDEWNEYNDFEKYYEAMINLFVLSLIASLKFYKPFGIFLQPFYIHRINVRML